MPKTADINRNRRRRFLEDAATEYNVRYIDRMGEMLRSEPETRRYSSRSRSRSRTVRTATVLTDEGELIEVNVEDLEVISRAVGMREMKPVQDRILRIRMILCRVMNNRQQNQKPTRHQIMQWKSNRSNLTLTACRA